MTTKPYIKPNSNWHRLLHLLDANGGTLYLAQLYKPRGGKATHPEVITNGMPLMTEFDLIAGPNKRYEKQAQHMGWVSIQRWKNRTWVTLLPKGRTILKALAEGKAWDREADVIARTPFKYRKTVTL